MASKLKTSMKCSVLGFAVTSIIVGVFGVVVGGLMIVTQHGDFTLEFGDICTLYRVGLIKAVETNGSNKMVLEENSDNSFGRPSAHLTCPALSSLLYEYYTQTQEGQMSKDNLIKLGDRICECRNGRTAAASLLLVAGILQLVSGVIIVIFKIIKLQVEVKANWLIFGRCHVAAVVLLLITNALCINFRMANRLQAPPTRENCTEYTSDNFQGKIFIAFSAIDFAWAAFVTFIFIWCVDCCKIFDKKKHKKGSRKLKSVSQNMEENVIKISGETEILPLDDFKVEQSESSFSPSVRSVQKPKRQIQEAEKELKTEDEAPKSDSQKQEEKKVEEVKKEEEPSKKEEAPPTRKPDQNIQYASKFVQAVLNRK